MQDVVLTRLQLERDLNKVVKNLEDSEIFQQFSIHYQPIIHLETQKINGFDSNERADRNQGTDKIV